MGFDEELFDAGFEPLGVFWSVDYIRREEGMKRAIERRGHGR